MICKNKICSVNLILLAFLLFLFSLPVNVAAVYYENALENYSSSHRARNDGRSPLGTNIPAAAYWSVGMPFTDLMKQATPFNLDQTAQLTYGVTHDAQGWPITTGRDGVMSYVMEPSDKFSYQSGYYVVLYEGSSDNISYPYSYGTDVQRSPGRDVIYVAPGNPLAITVNAHNIGWSERVRNIRVVRSGGVCKSNALYRVEGASSCSSTSDYLSFEQHHAGELKFNPDFIRHMAEFGVLRGMDLLQTNNSKLMTWENRPKIDDFSWSFGNNGIPLEIMVDLCNVMKADCWVNIPHQANDAYVRNAARLISQRLDSDLKLYLEYSNELWNSIFTAYSYAVVKGRSLGYNYYRNDQGLTSRSDHLGGIRYSLARTKQITAIFKDEFGGTNRLIRVLGSQAEGVYSTDLALKLDGNDGIDALAIGAYFGVSYGSTNPPINVYNATVDSLLGHMKAVEMPKVEKINESNAELAAKYDLSLVAYEGGQHLTGGFQFANSARLNALFDAANNDPRMGELYQTLLNSWKSLSVGAGEADVFVHFSGIAEDSKWGRWGMKQSYAQSDQQAYKYTAIKSFSRSNKLQSYEQVYNGNYAPSAGPITGGNASQVLLATADRSKRKGTESFFNGKLVVSPWDHSFVKFDLSQAPKDISSATLKLYYQGSRSVEVQAWRSDNDEWTETSAALPVQTGYYWYPQNLLSTRGAEPNSYIEFDVTSYVKSQRAADGVASFELGYKPSSGGGWQYVSSREGEQAPQLIVE